MPWSKKHFFGALSAALILLLLSWLGHQFSLFNSIAWWLLVAGIFGLALWRLEAALALVLLELTIGSFGYLLSWPFAGFNLSLRVGWFVAVMLAWLLINLWQLIKTRGWGRVFNFRRQPLFLTFLALGVICLWGLVNGWLRGHAPSNLLLDFNAWLFFLYFLPAAKIRKRINWPTLLGVVGGGLAANFLLTFLAFLVFTHGTESLIFNLYDWLRDCRLAEITFAGGNLWRIFNQSQIYTAVGAALFFWLWANEIKIKSWPLILFILSSLTVVISLSRSFWLGGLAALALIFAYLIWKRKIGFKKTVALILLLILIVGAEFGLVSLIAGAGAGELISQRLTDFGEAAGASRWNQLKPLSLAIAQHPVLGSGFGATVTYQSLDPRILKSQPDGWYTTYAFEWGYLDIILKVGVLGLLIYLILIGLIIKNLKSQIPNPNVQIGLIAGLAVILTANIFSPYLNHPLGIGYLLLLAVLNKKEDEARLPDSF